MNIALFAELKDNEIITPLNIEYVSSIECKYGIKLPESYVNLLKEQNGGYITRSIIPEYINDITVTRLSGIKGNNDDVLEESDYYINEWDLPKNILLLAGQGHWWICLDYRDINDNDEPRVSYIDSEMKRDLVIADSFEEFIKILV